MGSLREHGPSEDSRSGHSQPEASWSEESWPGLGRHKGSPHEGSRRKDNWQADSRHESDRHEGDRHAGNWHEAGRQEPSPQEGNPPEHSRSEDSSSGDSRQCHGFHADAGRVGERQWGAPSQARPIWGGAHLGGWNALALGLQEQRGDGRTAGRVDGLNGRPGAAEGDAGPSHPTPVPRTRVVPLRSARSNALASGSGAGGPAAPLSRYEQRLWRMLWNRCPGVGVVRLAQLERAFGGLQPAWKASPAELADSTRWSPALLEAIEAYRQTWGADPLPRLARELRGGRGILLPGDGRWPAALQALQRPPLWLHWRGRGSLWAPLARRQAIAVVGTRRPSEHGLRMAKRIGAQLAAQGWPVVSGLAEGIDAAAHQGCLAEGGSPVAVLGTPVQRVYPRHHQQLQRLVGERGLLLSEWAADAQVRPGHFASRNRLQVALAAAVVVVECPVGSGALHSAELAWSQGLPLWAVPGDAERLSALGSNRLLARGATPLLLPADLTAQLGPGPLARGRPPTTAAPRRRPPLDPGSAEGRLLAALGTGASLEQLEASLGLTAPALAARLLQLELAGLVQPEPGLRWRPR